MDRIKEFKGKILFILLFVTLLIIIFFLNKLPRTNWSVPPPRRPPATSPPVTKDTITPLKNTKHLLVSAFMDQRQKGFDVRIIGIFKRDSIQPLHCFFCSADRLCKETTPSKILQHSDNFGFPFATTDVLCRIPQNCDASYVTLVTQPEKDATTKHTWLPIRNKKTSGKNEKKPQFNFTVCVSNLFGDFNNVLQFAQTLEMYRLLGVNRVVIYNTSCGPELDRLLQSYSKEGFVEMVPWPIDKHLKPSGGWLFSEHGGDLHYYGQLATLNECIYRSMERSRYVLLNDIDEIIMPYQHNDLMSLMSTLEQQNPNAQVFLIENHIYPKKPFNESVMGSLPKWRGVPGFNILERVYKEEPDRNVFHPYKMIIQPRAVEQTSVHDVLKMSGQRFKVPPDICRIIHSPIKTPIELLIEQLHVDTRLLNFKDQLSPSVSKVLRRSGLLNSKGKD
ncbi:beta-1,4-galactosyltransferase galt-1-like [Mugil cephalus]|uniref:beta-1,4-galactosyltransferase galt-1-like n=1 Tax=Mugil cephalus TaxID=48193 RepID=UPI001FB77B25|nr:beta-1,4-galactosyltransferase galt-1-like [Mugil cephalus]